MTPSTTVSPPTFPDDVIAFAAESGVTDYLIPAYDRTRRVFPTARRITPVLEYDPEIAGLRWIIFRVEISGMTAEQYPDLDWRWSGELFKVCRATHVCRIGLNLDIRDT